MNTIPNGITDHWSHNLYYFSIAIQLIHNPALFLKGPAWYAMLGYVTPGANIVHFRRIAKLKVDRKALWLAISAIMNIWHTE